MIFATLSSSGRDSFIKAKNPIHSLIVDEAGQAHVSELMIPLHTRPMKMLLVGDHQQLPPTMIDMTQRGRINLYIESSMKRISENSKNNVIQLTEQYRMHSDIRYWPSLMYYEGKLTDSQCVLARRSLIPQALTEWCKPLSSFDVYDGKEMKRGTSLHNEEEVKFIVKLVNKLCKYGVRYSSIGIISFYSAQVANFKELYKNTEIEVNSVDGFQGSEKDIIIISFVRSNPRNMVGFVRDFRRLNVALTRGKHAVLMVGNINTLQNSDSEDLRSLMGHVPFLDSVHIENTYFTERGRR
jgi:senataxin